MFRRFVGLSGELVGRHDRPTITVTSKGVGPGTGTRREGNTARSVSCRAGRCFARACRFARARDSQATCRSLFGASHRNGTLHPTRSILTHKLTPRVPFIDRDFLGLRLARANVGVRPVAAGSVIVQVERFLRGGLGRAMRLTCPYHLLIRTHVTASGARYPSTGDLTVVRHGPFTGLVVSGRREADCVGALAASVAARDWVSAVAWTTWTKIAVAAVETIWQEPAIRR